ncbi:MAG: trypsin, partial [Nitrosopumilaceae archaeon]|nr:trypsin [Nitrosopumilaceae archaeon]
MDKSGIIVGGVFGAVAVLVIFAVLLVPPTSLEPPSKELVVSNGHGPSTVGETTPIPSTKKLSLIEIFERTESGTVRVEVKRASQVSGSNGVGSGFVFDRSGHIITNAHVIDDAKKIIVTFLDGRSYNAD